MTWEETQKTLMDATFDRKFQYSSHLKLLAPALSKSPSLASNFSLKSLEKSILLYVNALPSDYN